MLAVTSCAGWKKTEVAVVTYESTAVALKTAYVYLSEREKNGSLSGEPLARAKADYNLARNKFIQAGDMLKKAIESPLAFNQALYQSLLEQAAVAAAQLSKGGGK